MTSPEPEGQYNEDTDITFDASSSYDPDGDLLSYRWGYETKDNWILIGEIATVISTLDVGYYNISLEVRDSVGNIVWMNFSITVGDPEAEEPEENDTEPSDDQEVTMKNYVHERFSMDYPSSWIASEDDSYYLIQDDERYERFSFGESLNTGGSGAAIDIIPMEKKDWDYDSSVTENVNEFKSIISDYDQISFTKIDHPDQGEIWIHECSQTMLGDTEMVIQAFFKSDDLMIVLTCISDEDEYDLDKQNYYNTMIQSMEVYGEGPNSNDIVDDDGDNMIMWIIIVSSSIFVLLIIIVVIILIIGKNKKEGSKEQEVAEEDGNVLDVNLENRKKGIEYRYSSGMITYDQYMKEIEDLK